MVRRFDKGNSLPVRGKIIEQLSKTRWRRHTETNFIIQTKNGEYTATKDHLTHTLELDGCYESIRQRLAIFFVYFVSYLAFYPRFYEDQSGPTFPLLQAPRHNIFFGEQ